MRARFLTQRRIAAVSILGTLLLALLWWLPRTFRSQGANLPAPRTTDRSGAKHAPAEQATLPRAEQKAPAGAAARTAEGPDLVSIAVLATNDIHGALFPVTEEGIDPATGKQVRVERGGLGALSGLLAALRSTWGDRLLWLDAGDQFQGSYESNQSQGAVLVSLLNQLGLSAAAIGNHEFDFGWTTLLARVRESKAPYLSANLRWKHQPERDPPFAQTAMLQAGPLRVGVIGLSTPETQTTTHAANLTEVSIVGWQQGLAARTAALAKQLRTQGAHLVLLVAHMGIECGVGIAKHIPRTVTAADPPCNDGSEIARLVDALPAGSIDGVIAGHSHRLVTRFVLEGGSRPIPAVQAGHHLQYANVLYFQYDLRKKSLASDRTRIEGPLPVCEQTFSGTGDCHIPKHIPKAGLGTQNPWQFQGKQIVPQPAMTAALQALHQQLDVTANAVIGQAARLIQKSGRFESPLGNLVSDAMVWAMQQQTPAAQIPSIALINGGGLRADLDAGPITFGEIFRVLPFDNPLCTAALTGAELLGWLRQVYAARPHGWAFSGLRMVAHAGSAGLDISLADGTPLDPGKTYLVGMADFLFEGGSVLGSKLPISIRQRKACLTGEEGLIRNVVIRYIRHQQATVGPLHTHAHPLVDPASPRFLADHVR